MNFLDEYAIPMEIENNFFAFKESKKQSKRQHDNNKSQQSTTCSEDELDALPTCSTRTCSISSISNGSPLIEETTTSMLLQLPSNILNLITIFLLPNELIRLQCSGRRMHEKIVQQAQLTISLMALKYFFNSEISKFVEYGEEQAYLACKAERNTRIADGMKASISEKLKSLSLFKSSLQSTQSLAPLSEIFTDLRNPPMPSLKIRRENIGKHAHSWFQNKLVEAYIDAKAKASKSTSKSARSLADFGDSSSTYSLHSIFQQGQSNTQLRSFQFDLPFSFIASPKSLKLYSQCVSESQKSMLALSKQQQKMHRQQQAQQRIVELLDAIRWYKDFDELATIDSCVDMEVHRFIDENDCVKVAMIVSNMFKQHCEVTHEFLEMNYEHATYYDMISEYNLQWNTYQASIIQIQDNLDEIYKTFEEVYVSEVNVQMFPVYSLLRVASQHWSRIVLLPLKEKLFESFFNLIQSRRNENLQLQITNDYSRIESQNSLGYFYVPEKLSVPSQVLLQRMVGVPSMDVSAIKGVSNSREMTAPAFEANDKGYSHFFSQNTQFIDNMLASFSENMMDLSVNEASVHWLGHSDLQVGNLYKELHQLFVGLTNNYFSQLDATLFVGFPMQWREFLFSELKYSRQIMKEITVRDTRSLVLNHFFGAFVRDCEREYAMQSQERITPNQLRSAFNSSERQIIAGKMAAKGMSSQAIAALLSLPQQKGIVDAFIISVEDEENFASKSLRDEDIEIQNRYCQITQYLDEDSFAFYDLAHSLNPSLLEKTKDIIREKILINEDNGQLSEQDECREYRIIQQQSEEEDQEEEEKQFRLGGKGPTAYDLLVQQTNEEGSFSFHVDQYNSQIQPSSFGFGQISGNKGGFLGSILGGMEPQGQLDNRPQQLVDARFNLISLPDNNDNFFDDIDNLLLSNSKQDHMLNQSISGDRSTQEDSFNSHEFEEEL